MRLEKKVLPKKTKLRSFDFFLRPTGSYEGFQQGADNFSPAVGDHLMAMNVVFMMAQVIVVLNSRTGFQGQNLGTVGCRGNESYWMIIEFTAVVAG